MFFLLYYVIAEKSKTKATQDFKKEEDKPEKLAKTKIMADLGSHHCKRKIMF